MSLLPSGIRDVDLDQLDENGECRRSALPPAYCGLACHRNSEDVPVIDDVYDDQNEEAA